MNRLTLIPACAIFALAQAAHAQIVCNNLGGQRYCTDASNVPGYGGSSAPLGGSTTVIRNYDGSHTTINQLEGTTVIRNPDGSRSTINQLDGSTIIRDSNGNRSTITPLGGGTVIRSNNGGGTTTINQLGGGTVLRSNEGTTTYTPLGGVNGGTVLRSNEATVNGLGNAPIRNGGGSGLGRCTQMGTTVACD